jgi:Zn-dependent protease
MGGNLTCRCELPQAVYSRRQEDSHLPAFFILNKDNVFVPMPMQTAFEIPFLLTPGRLAVDSIVSFVVSALVAITVNAEAQAFAATLFGDTRTGSTDRLHFNAFLHIDILGGLCFLLGGFGWPRQIAVDDAKFEHPRLYLALTRLAGPLGNFLMANIAGSIAWIFALMNTDPRVFHMLMGVNLTVAVANLIPIPPLAAGSVLTALFLPGGTSLQPTFQRIGPFVILGLVAIDRLAGWDSISSAMAPLVQSMVEMIRI